MTINYKVTGKDRKKLVDAISKTLGTESNYLGAPSYSYTIGQYIIDRNGTLTGPDDRTLVSNLYSLRFFGQEEYAEPQPWEAAPETAVDTPDAPDPAPAVDGADEPPETAPAAPEMAPAAPPAPKAKRGRKAKAAAPDAPDPAPAAETTETAPEPTASAEAMIAETDKISIELPMKGFTPESLDNLCKLAASKGTLIKKALGVEELPIQVLEDKIVFPWINAGTDSEHITAYTQFLTCLAESAKTKKRVIAKSQESYENEKYAMRVWLLGLGLIGSEFALARKLLMANLGGNGSWRYGTPEKTNKAPDPALGDIPPHAEEPAPDDEAPAPAGEPAPDGEPTPDPAPGDTGTDLAEALADAALIHAVNESFDDGDTAPDTE